jgi:hypothetical protein
MVIASTRNGAHFNSPHGGLADMFVVNQLREMVSNVASLRKDMFSRFADPRRDVESECGYPSGINFSPEKYQDLYDHEPMAKRVVDIYPREAWQMPPKVFTKDKSKVVTDFDLAFVKLDQMVAQGRSWHKSDDCLTTMGYLARSNEQCRIGKFGVMLIGLNDGKFLHTPVEWAKVDWGDEPVPRDGQAQDITGVTAYTVDSSVAAQATQPTGRQGTDEQYSGTQFSTWAAMGGGDVAKTPKDRRITFIRVFPEHLVQVVQYESALTNPRFGQPIMYLITMNDPRQHATGVGLPQTTVRVHWSRVVHHADNLTSSEVFGVPAIRPVLYPIMDIKKVRGASAEGYWSASFPGISFETHPQLGGDVDIDTQGLRNMYEQYKNSLQRALFLSGMAAKTLGPTVTEPRTHIDIQIETICISLACPKRVFMGSERGELASSQDDSSWNDRLRAYQQRFITPKIIAPFIDRLIMYGVLPEPDDGYFVDWPDLDSMSDQQKATVGLTRAQMWGAFITGDLEQVMTPEFFATNFDTISAGDAKKMLKQAAKAQEEQQTEDAATAQEHGMVPTPPAGFQHPPQPPMAPGGKPGGKPPGGKPFGGPPKPPGGAPKPPPQPKQAAAQATQNYNQFSDYEGGNASVNAAIRDVGYIADSCVHPSVTPSQLRQALKRVFSGLSDEDAVAVGRRFGVFGGDALKTLTTKLYGVKGRWDAAVRGDAKAKRMAAEATQGVVSGLPRLQQLAGVLNMNSEHDDRGRFTSSQAAYPHMAHLLNGTELHSEGHTKAGAKQVAKELRSQGTYANLWKDAKTKTHFVTTTNFNPNHDNRGRFSSVDDSDVAEDRTRQRTREILDKVRDKLQTPYTTKGTAGKYRNPDGTWSPERQPLHERIERSFYKDVKQPPDGAKTVYMTGGGAGSGKSSLFHEHETTGMPSKDKAPLIDPDAAKQQIPEMAQRAAAGDRGAASYVHAGVERRRVERHARGGQEGLQPDLRHDRRQL